MQKIPLIIRLFRLLTLLFWAIFLLMMGMMGLSAVVEGRFWELLPLLLFLSLFFVGIPLWILYNVPAVWLEEDGVVYQSVFRKRKVSWKEIPQAGILWAYGRGGWYNDFVLLKPGGSLRRYRDKTFALRNTCRLLHLPCTEAVRSYVLAHYGPLDFDLSDGKPEQIIVVGSCLRDDTPWE